MMMICNFFWFDHHSIYNLNILFMYYSIQLYINTILNNERFYICLRQFCVLAFSSDNILSKTLITLL